jgi:hypothetical protein
MIKFIDEGHIYANVDGNDFQWVSVTKLVHQFVEKFNAPLMAEKCSKGKNLKYKGKTPEAILALWDKESKRSTDLGTWYHNQREADMLNCNTITRDGIELPIVSPLIDNKIKLAPDQTITEGIYPEHLVYLKSASICGQADRVEIVGDRIDVYDYKTNKEIKTRGYKFYDGTYKMMLGPVKHLEDCEINHYALQLSIYMYVIQKHNFNLNPGKIQIQHVEFEIDHEDENGYPVHALDAGGEPIIGKINRFDLPYLKKEVIAMLKWLKINKQMVLHDAH